MIEMFMDSAQLFVTGKLFQDYQLVFRQMLIGIVIAVVICVVLSQLGTGMWVAVGLASLVSGAVQPYLFKDLKYK